MVPLHFRRENRSIKAPETPNQAAAAGSPPGGGETWLKGWLAGWLAEGEGGPGPRCVHLSLQMRCLTPLVETNHVNTREREC